MRVLSAVARLTVALVKAIALLALLGGVPAGLATQIPWPSLAQTRHTLHNAVTDPLSTVEHTLTGGLSDTTAIVLLAVALWILWAAFALSVAVEVGAVIRGVPVPHYRLLAPTQILAGWLLAGVLAAAPVATAVGHTAPPTAVTAPPTPISAHAPARPDPTLRPAAWATSAVSRPAATTVSTTAAATPRAATTGQPVYVVARGDWLGEIAHRYLGSFDRYPDIKNLNPHLIPDNTGPHGPDHIEPTWELTLPADAYDRGPRPHATGHLVVTPPPPPTTPGGPSGACPTPAPATPKPPPSTPPLSAAPSVAPSAADPDGVVTPPAPTTTPATGTPTPRPSAPATSAAPGPDPTATHTPDSGVGVSLPGGWISIGLAAAIALAGGMVWLRRRRRYIPGPLAGPALHDPDLQPLPAVVEVARRAVRRQAPELLHPPRDTLTVREAADLRRAGQPVPPPPPPGPDGPHLAGLAEPLPPGGLGLTGSGGEDAARALLVAILSAGGPDDPDARGQVVIPAATFATLLGAAAVDVGTIPRLTVTPDLPAALTHLEELIIARRRLLEDEDAIDADDLHDSHRYATPMPPVLLLAEPPPAQLRARLATTLHLGRPLHLSAVLLGEWPRGDTVTVHPDGHTTGSADGQRLSVLDTATAAQLLNVLREAHTGERVPHGPADPIASPPTSPHPGADNGDEVSSTPPTPAPPADEEPEPADAPPRPANATAVHDMTVDDATVHTDEATPTGTPAEPDSPGSTAPLRARAHVLGTPALLRLDGSQIDQLRGNALEMLVFLAVHRDGASLDDVKLALYPDAQVTRADERLATDVGNLRNRIRHIIGALPKSTLQPVVNTGGRYHLNPDLVEVDWWTVQDAIAQATTAKNDPAAREQALRRAVHAYHGPLADTMDYDWAPEAREHVRRQGVLIHTHLAALVAEADPTDAAQLLDTACELDPYNEELACQTLQAHARAGDADALRTRLRRLRTALDDLDEQPDEATEALAADLLGHIPAPPGRRKPQPSAAEDD